MEEGDDVCEGRIRTPADNPESNLDMLLSRQWSITEGVASSGILAGQTGF